MAARDGLRPPALAPRLRRRLVATEVLAAALAANAGLLLVLEARRSAGTMLAFLPAILLLVGVFSAHSRWVLAIFALGATVALPFSFVGAPLPRTGGTTIFPSDLVVVLSLGAWALARLVHPGANERLPVPRVFLPPLLLLAVGLAIGVFRGHYRYGESLIGQPFRMVIYAGIAAALTGVTAARLYRAVVVVFYAAIVLEALLGLYYLATGRSQTDQTDLSTGGTRALALGTAIYLSGGLVLALLNLELDERPARRIVHLVMATLATFGIVIAYGRTNFVALAVILPLMVLALRRMRTTLGAMVPLLVPGVAVVVLLVAALYPRLGPTLWERLRGTSGTDLNVVWRERATAATLQGLSQSPVIGMGFGRPVTFQLPSDNGIPVYDTVQGDPHNSYAYVLGGGGFVALAGLLWLFAAFVVNAVRRARRSIGRERVLVLWSLAFWFVFAVNALAGPVLSRADFILTIWVLMLIPSAIRPSPTRPDAAPAPRRRAAPAETRA